MAKEKKTLEELRQQIADEIDYVDIKPYSHNIIGCVLRIIDRDYGTEEANNAVREFGLDEMGWKTIEVKNG